MKRARLTVYLSPETERRLRVACAEDGVERSATIEDAVLTWLDRRDEGDHGELRVPDPAMRQAEAIAAWYHIGAEIGAID